MGVRVPLPPRLLSMAHHKETKNSGENSNLNPTTVTKQILLL